MDVNTDGRWAVESNIVAQLLSCASELKGLTAKAFSGKELGDFICETLTFCYSPQHKKNLQKEAKKMKGTFEQFVAAALVTRILERFDVSPKRRRN